MGKSTESLKHKPSKKVVLEEVLTSLQDLVNNEFADDQAATETPPNVLRKADPATGPRKRGRPRKHPLPEKPPARSDKTDYTYSQDQADLFAQSAPAETPPGANGTPKPAKAPRSRQAEIKANKKTPPSLESPRKRANLKVVEPTATDMSNKPSNAAKTLSPQASLDWADDIPVLTEVIDPRELNIGELQDVVDQSLARKDLAPEAREIAVKVAAKLNIEARKSGGEQLDVKTIMRLQALLKEALEPRD